MVGDAGEVYVEGFDCVERDADGRGVEADLAEDSRFGDHVDSGEEGGG